MIEPTEKELISAAMMAATRKELANKIKYCCNIQELDKLCDLYYDNMDDEMKDLFYDMNTILFNKEMLNPKNYLHGCIGNDVDKLLQSQINFKYNKLRKSYEKIVEE